MSEIRNYSIQYSHSFCIHTEVEAGKCHKIIILHHLWDKVSFGKWRQYYSITLTQHKYSDI